MTGGGRRAIAAVLIVGMLGSVTVAGLSSLFASQEPDGLQRVAQEQGFAENEEPSATSEGPFGGYALDGVENESLSSGVSAAAGLGLTLVLGMGLFWFLSRKPSGETGSGGSVSGAGLGFGPPVGEGLASEPAPGDDPWPERE